MNRFKDRLAVPMQGRATFSIKDDKGNLKREWTRKNAIQPTAKDITARRLIVHPTSAIDTIALYYLGNLVAGGLINQTGIVAAAEVFFQTTFQPLDFNGPFDEARLTASSMGDFSIIIDLVGSKNDTESLLVTWNIQIN